MYILNNDIFKSDKYVFKINRENAVQFSEIFSDCTGYLYDDVYHFVTRVLRHYREGRACVRYSETSQLELTDIGLMQATEHSYKKRTALDAIDMFIRIEDGHEIEESDMDITCFI